MDGNRSACEFCKPSSTARHVRFHVTEFLGSSSNKDEAINKSGAEALDLKMPF